MFDGDMRVIYDGEDVARHFQRRYHAVRLHHHDVERFAERTRTAVCQIFAPPPFTGFDFTMLPP